MRSPRDDERDPSYRESPRIDTTGTTEAILPGLTRGCDR